MSERGGEIQPFTAGEERAPYLQLAEQAGRYCYPSHNQSRQAAGGAGDIRSLASDVVPMIYSLDQGTDDIPTNQEGEQKPQTPPFHGGYIYPIQEEDVKPLESLF